MTTNPTTDSDMADQLRIVADHLAHTDKDPLGKIVPFLTQVADRLTPTPDPRPSEEIAYRAILEAFSHCTGVRSQTDEDVRALAAVEAMLADAARALAAHFPAART